MSLARVNVLPWDDTFMAIAHVVKLRSKDPSTQVGACLVGEDKRILSLGYNGAPNGFSDDTFPWGKTGNEIDTKYPFVVHAERNAILNFRGNLRELKGSSIFVTLFPCNECSKEIIQTGVKEIVYQIMPEENTIGIESSLLLLRECGVSFRKFEAKVHF